MRQDFSASSSSEVWSLRSFPASSSEVYNNATSYRSRQAILASLCFVQDIKRIIGDFDRRSLTGRHSKTRLILACCHTTAVKVSRGATETAPPPQMSSCWEMGTSYTVSICHTRQQKCHVCHIESRWTLRFLTITTFLSSNGLRSLTKGCSISSLFCVI